MMRPLYINGDAGTVVELDGPALKISVPERAQQLFPLSRVSRVVVTGRVNWRTDALLACAELGITVTFLDAEGNVTARCLGKGGQRQAFLQRLSDLLARPDGKALYDGWRLAMRRMVVQSTARSLLRNKHMSVTSGELLAFFVAQQGLLPMQPVEPVYCKVRGLLSAHVAQLLHEQSLDARSELLQETWLDIRGDFSELLFWDLQVPLLLWLKSQASVPTSYDCARFYHERSGRIARLCQGLANKLHRWLVELY